MNKIIILSLSIFFSSASVWAFGSMQEGVLVGLSTSMFNTSTEGTSIGTNDATNSYYDGKIGYLSDDWYFGGIYSATNGKPSSSLETKRTAYGITIGYHSSGFLFDASYMISASYDYVVSGVTLNYGKGTGTIFDLGYNAMINDSFYAGAQLTYRSFTYTEITLAGLTTSQDNKQKSEMYPMINLGFIF